MKASEFAEGQRRYVRKTLEGHLAYFPPPVPREIQLDPALVNSLSLADRRLGELSGVGRRLPNPRMLIRPYLHREAVLSSRIEGTQSSLSELILFEAEGAPENELGDVREVLNYVEALEWGIAQLATLPISQRLVLGLHRRLLEGVRGEETTPGRFRDSQNWIGSHRTPIEQAIYVPPPPSALPELLDDWEKYVHERDDTPPLIRCALIHYQFETIHPFRDGNGRIGRLLMPLFLISQDCLSEPLLYLSAYFERRREEYYDVLSAGRTTGDLGPWLRLFLTAVATQAQDASDRADELTRLQANFRKRVATSRSRVVHGLIDDLFVDMYVTAKRVASRQRVTPPAARAAIEELVEAKILREMTGRVYGRVYAAPEILSIIDRQAPV